MSTRLNAKFVFIYLSSKYLYNVQEDVIIIPVDYFMVILYDVV